MTTVLRNQELTKEVVENIINNAERNARVGLIDQYPSMRVTNGVAEIAQLQDTSWLMDILYDAFEVCSEHNPHIEIALEVHEDNSADLNVTDGQDGVYTVMSDTFNNCSFPTSIKFAVDLEGEFGKVSII